MASSDAGGAVAAVCAGGRQGFYDSDAHAIGAQPSRPTRRNLQRGRGYFVSKIRPADGQAGCNRMAGEPRIGRVNAVEPADPTNYARRGPRGAVDFGHLVEARQIPGGALGAYHTATQAKRHKEAIGPKAATPGIPIALID